MIRWVRCFVVATALSAAAVAQQSTEKVVQAANKFLGTLTEEQRGKVMFAFGDTTQQAKWSNFPTGFVPRSGINLKSMNEAQKAAALDLMKVVLSPMARCSGDQPV